MGCPEDTSDASFHGCPHHSNYNGTPINPLTNLPYDLHEGSDNTLLSKDRVVSSIPRTPEKLPTGQDKETKNLTQDDSSSIQKWTYPSPQMFYSALKKKGYETNPKDINMMVDIHNSLNEQVWTKILEWEDAKSSICPNPSLKRFRGRPNDLSLRAKWNMYVRGSDKPFDRHDWVVDRCGKDIRYIIDYYEGNPEADGSPTMNVDVRPAPDSIENLFDIFKKSMYNIFK